MSTEPTRPSPQDRRTSEPEALAGEDVELTDVDERLEEPPEEATNATDDPGTEPRHRR